MKLFAVLSQLVRHVHTLVQTCTLIWSRSLLLKYENEMKVFARLRMGQQGTNSYVVPTLTLHELHNWAQIDFGPPD